MKVQKKNKKKGGFPKLLVAAVGLLGIAALFMRDKKPKKNLEPKVAKKKKKIKKVA